MKLLLALSLFWLCATLGFAQKLIHERPDYESIEKAINDTASANYYPKLMQRFLDNDTTLTLTHYKLLYYGYTFQKEYIPYPDLPHDSIIAHYAGLTGAEKCDTIIKYASQGLQIMPLDIFKLNRLAYAYHLKGNDATAKLYGNKAKQLMEVILTTGNGRSTQTAWHVISVSDEYEIIYVLRFYPMSQQLIGHECDYITLAENTSRLQGLYFNIRRLLDVEAARTKKN